MHRGASTVRLRWPAGFGSVGTEVPSSRPSACGLPRRQRRGADVASVHVVPGTARRETEVSRCAGPERVRSGPPRCFADLQRMTAERICSVGFAAPPSSFAPCGVDPGVFRSTAVQSVSLLAELPLMVLRSPSRTSSVLRFVRPVRLTKPSCPGKQSPLRFYAPSTLPARGIHFPVRSFRPDLSGVASTARSKPCCFGSPVPVGSSAVDLVAGFHTRFGPPSPFLTTMTVCSSPNPVTCFGHTRP
jgi:hypothetical protein